MFPKFTKAIVEKLSANLISNDDLNRNWELLTLVKIRKKNLFTYFDSRAKYQPLALKLSSIVDADLDLETETKMLVKDFQSFSCLDGAVEVGGGSGDVQVDVKGQMKTVDASSKVSLMSDHFRFHDLEKLTFRSMWASPWICKQLHGETQTSRSTSFFLSCRKLEQKVLDVLQLKDGEKLAFVKQRVFNTGPVHVFREASRSGSTGAKVLNLVSAGVKGGKAEKSKFTVPENKTFAFALKKLMVQDGVLGFSSEISYKAGSGVIASEAVLIEAGLQRNQAVLKPLAGRTDLLRGLVEVLEDRDALTLLEDTLDLVGSGEYQRPQCEAAAWFLTLLDVSTASRELTDAVHLLVSALEALPGDLPALLARCDPGTLSCIIHMMDCLLYGQVPPPLERPLQEDKELHRLVRLLHSAKDFRDLRENFPDFSPEALLELLYVGVRGLSLMQSPVCS
ncbi:uncharacterized protein LOC105925755 [Fundulus heteroclitus]|uniref:uncharacterized protein LOC105925755 n=1 Tax=Fundulus heteroclitus TaxID=8078 RepID=UPI00165AC9CB|nr:uncharacterized protein LOC105925755 [Fundulus heteroclitus]